MTQHAMPRARRGWRTALFLGAAFLMACVGDKGVAPSTRDATAALGIVSVAPLNAIMAVGDTMSLTVTGHTLSGAPIASFDSIQYVFQNPSDSVAVHISANGLVTALSPSGVGSPIYVQVMVFKDGLARADVAILQVTDHAIAGATLSIQPGPSDSTRLAVGNDKFIVPVIQNAAGDQQVGFPAVRYEVSDSTVMQCYIPDFMSTPTVNERQLTTSSCGGHRVNLDVIHGNVPGTAWVIASVRVYGVALRDSVLYTVTNPVIEYVVFSPTNLALGGLSTNTYIITPGGSMVFYNGFDPSTGAMVSWVFDDPSAATATNPPATDGDTTGNVSSIGGGLFSTRLFPTAGTYPWTATVTGAFPPFTGAIVKGAVIVR